MEVGKVVRQDFIEMLQGTMVRGEDSGAEGPRFISLLSHLLTVCS